MRRSVCAALTQEGLRLAVWIKPDLRTTYITAFCQPLNHLQLSAQQMRPGLSDCLEPTAAYM